MTNVIQRLINQCTGARPQARESSESAPQAQKGKSAKSPAYKKAKTTILRKSFKGTAFNRWTDSQFRSLVARVNSLSRQLKTIPPAGTQHSYDVIFGQYASPVGATAITGLGRFGTSAIGSPFSFTSSQLDPYLLTWNIFNALTGRLAM